VDVGWKRAWALIPLGCIVRVENMIDWIGEKLTTPRLYLLQYIGCPIDVTDMKLRHEFIRKNIP
jgi:hypothetical protein